MASTIADGFEVRRRLLRDEIGAGIQKTLLDLLGASAADALERGGVLLGIDARQNASLETVMLAEFV